MTRIRLLLHVHRSYPWGLRSSQTSFYRADKKACPTIRILAVSCKVYGNKNNLRLTRFCYEKKVYWSFDFFQLLAVAKEKGIGSSNQNNSCKTYKRIFTLNESNPCRVFSVWCDNTKRYLEYGRYLRYTVYIQCILTDYCKCVYPIRLK